MFYYLMKEKTMNFVRHYRISKNKSIEFEINSKLNIPFYLSFRIDTKTDHAGLHFSLSIFNVFISFQFHDNRHYNYDLNEWC
jgi:hypothetical protein